MECEAWWEAKSDERLVKLESLKSSRNRSIRAKLNDLGYGEELNKLPDDYTDLAIDMGFLLFADHPLVRKAQALTDKGESGKGGTIQLNILLCSLGKYQRTHDRVHGRGESVSNCIR